MQPPSFLFMFFFFNDPATTEIYTLSLHDALPIPSARGRPGWQTAGLADESPRSVQLVDRVIDVALDLPDVGVIAVDGVQYVPRPDKVGLCARIRGARRVAIRYAVAWSPSRRRCLVHEPQSIFDLVLGCAGAV